MTSTKEWKFKYLFDLVRIIDGDTIVARLDLGMKTYVEKHIRLVGFDAPEEYNTKEVKPVAKYSALYLEELLTNNENMWLVTEKDHTGKYGRLLATLYVEKLAPQGPPVTININEAMIDFLEDNQNK